MVLEWFRKIVMAFALGTLTFTPWEILMVRAGVVEYAKPQFLGIPLWLPLLFGAAACGAILFLVVFDRFFHTQLEYQGGHLVFEYLLLALVYTPILLFHGTPYLLSLGLLLIVALRLSIFHQPWDVLVFLIGACLGPTLELLLTSLNLYFFTEPDFLGMPYWLPLLFGVAMLAMRRLAWVLEPPPLPSQQFLLTPKGG